MLPLTVIDKDGKPQAVRPLQIPDSLPRKIPAWPVPARRGHWDLKTLSLNTLHSCWWDWTATGYPLSCILLFWSDIINKPAKQQKMFISQNKMVPVNEYSPNRGLVWFGFLCFVLGVWGYCFGLVVVFSGGLGGFFAIEHLPFNALLLLTLFPDPVPHYFSSGKENTSVMGRNSATTYKQPLQPYCKDLGFDHFLKAPLMLIYQYMTFGNKNRFVFFAETQLW